MPISPGGYWIPRLSEKQIEVFNCYKRFILVSGPRKSGKTIGVIHRIIRHMWETPNARVAIVSKTKTAAKEGGVWDDFNQIVIPEWRENCPGFEYATRNRDNQPGPHTIGDTRTPHFSILNAHGGESSAILLSLDVDAEVEQKLKQKRFSCIYFPELSVFHDRKVFTISMQQLRMDLPRESHMWIADTNPAEAGEEHFAFKMWFLERTQKDHPDPEYQKDFALIEIFIDDNPFLSPKDKQEIYNAHRHSPEMLDRMYYGKWTASSTEGFFKDVFRPSIHILGNVDPPNEDDWETILPTKETLRLYVGWDIGFKNHSIHVVAKRETIGWSEFDVIDEVISIDESDADGRRVTIADLAYRFMERKTYWEKIIGHPIEWVHWSDSSALDQYRPYAEGTCDALEISKCTNGEVELQAAPKYSGSVPQRIDRVQKILSENRLFVSAQCFRTIAMLRKLRRAKSGAKIVARTEAGHEHVFDSLSYILVAESNRDAMDQRQPEVGQPSRMVQLRY